MNPIAIVIIGTLLTLIVFLFLVLVLIGFLYLIGGLDTELKE